MKSLFGQKLQGKFKKMRAHAPGGKFFKGTAKRCENKISSGLLELELKNESLKYGKSKIANV